MTDALALFALVGLLATVNLAGTVMLALYVSRQREQVKHCIQIVTTLLKAYEAETGTKVAVDPALLGEPLDVVAEDGSDVFSQIPKVTPWGVR